MWFGVKYKSEITAYLFGKLSLREEILNDETVDALFTIAQ